MSKEVTLAEIEQSAKAFSVKRKNVAHLVEAFEERIAVLHRVFMPRIRKAVEGATEAELELRNLVEEAPGLFVKPKTVIFHGIKVGYTKLKGGIDFDDDEKVVALIRKHYKGDDADALLHITTKPDKEALAKLTVDELKKLGCTVKGTGDVVVIKSTDSEIDKQVAALLKSAVDEAIKEEAA